MKFFTLVLFLFISVQAITQECQSFTHSFEYNLNEIKLGIHTEDEATNKISLRTKTSEDGDIGKNEYASLFYSSNIWAGGIDSDGEIRVAAGTYGGIIESDWKPGPLSPDGQIIENNCEQWDMTFHITKEEIRTAIYLSYDETSCTFNQGFDCDGLPESIKNYPARGNSFFFSDSNSDIALQSYGQFFDRSGNGIYEPCDGDFPYLAVTGCENSTTCSYRYLDYMPTSFAYWITNDGGTHDLTGGASLQLEVHHFAMFFNNNRKQDIRWNYLVKNKGDTPLENFHFSLWGDYDIGCYTDDYTGVDVQSNGMFFYNEDSLDGDNVSSNCQDLNTFGDEVPLLGYKVLRGLLQPDSNGNLTSTNMSSAVLIPLQVNLENDSQYFNIMNGSKPNGDSFLDPNDNPTKYLYTGNPSIENDWSMCTDELGNLIYKTQAVLSTQCDILQPGQTNEIQTLLSYTDDISLPCPDLQYEILNLWDGFNNYINCDFNIEGPSAPNLVPTFSDNKIELTFDNNFLTSNNKNLSFERQDPWAPSIPGNDNTYNFEGYKLYQVASREFDLSLLNNTSVSELISQSDLDNNIDDIYNWYGYIGPGNIIYYDSEKKVDGANDGIDEAVTIDFDYINNDPLVPGKSYYYVAIAYAYNNWEVWSNADQTGQRLPYLEGTHNVKVTEIVFDQTSSNEDISNEYELSRTVSQFTVNDVKIDTKAILLNTQGQKVGLWNIPKYKSLTVDYSELQMPNGIYILSLSSNDEKKMRSYKIQIIK